MKRCPKCGTDNAPDQFYVNARTKDGLQNWCKSCSLEYQRARQRSRITNRSLSPHSQRSLHASFSLPIRPDHVVAVYNLPVDLTKAESDRIGRILMAHAIPDLEECD